MFGGKQKFVALGLRDTPENRVIAEKKALQANLDISNNEFDFTLEKYKPVRHLAVVQEPIVIKPQYKLGELWALYVDYKRPNVSPSTVKNGYSSVTAHISRLPTTDLSDAIKIRNYLVSNQDITPDATRRLIMQFNACCEWALKSKLIDSNPFAGMNEEVKLPKSQRRTEEDLEDINPFTADERDAIIAAFESNKYCSKFASKNKKHSNYAPYIKFMFFTGCRPSEAIALQWKHIEFKPTTTTILFEQAVVQGENGLTLKKGLKTQKYRRINVSNRVTELLTKIKPSDAKSDDLVFPSPVTRAWIDVSNFSQRVWKPLLIAMGMEYRKPYNTRHTFITLAIQDGARIHDIKRVCGTSSEVIERHYLGNTRDFQMPET
jgi:integrase